MNPKILVALPVGAALVITSFYMGTLFPPNRSPSCDDVGQVTAPPSSIPAHEEIESRPREMTFKRLIYMIAIHSPSSARWSHRLLEKVYHRDDLFMFHVDDNAERSATLATLGNHTIVGARPDNVIVLTLQPVRWGHVSQVQMAFDMLQEASLVGGSEWSHALILSGDAYPLMPIDVLRSTLLRSHDINFVPCKSGWEAGNSRFMACHAREEKPTVTPAQLWHGPSWWAVNRRFVFWMLGSRWVRNLLVFAACSSSPDEAFFQTALMNSEFARTKTSNITFMWTKWEGGANAVVIQKRHLDEVFGNTVHLFGRKVRSADMASAIEERIKKIYPHRPVVPSATQPKARA